MKDLVCWPWCLYSNFFFLFGHIAVGRAVIFRALLDYFPLTKPIMGVCPGRREAKRKHDPN
jgi:hypothetical protein